MQRRTRAEGRQNIKIDRSIANMVVRASDELYTTRDGRRSSYIEFDDLFTTTSFDLQ